MPPTWDLKFDASFRPPTLSGEKFAELKSKVLREAAKRNVRFLAYVIHHGIVDADRVESLCGYKPDLDAVASFVSSRVRAGVPEGQKTAVSQVPSGQQPVAAAGGRPGPDRLGFRLHSREFSASSARDVLIKVFEELAARDKSFLERFAARARHGRTRRYVAREKSELYPGRPDLADEYSHQLQSGWWIGTNYHRQGITKIIQLASEVAGISFGTDLMINVG